MMKLVNPSTPLFWGFTGALVGFTGALNLGHDNRFVDGAIGALIQFFLWYGVSDLTLKRRRKLRGRRALSVELQSQDQSLVSEIRGWVTSLYKTGSGPDLPKIGLKVWFTIFFITKAGLNLFGLWEENRRIYGSFDPTFDGLLNKFFDDVYSPRFIDIFIFPNLIDACVFTSAIYLYRKFKNKVKNPYYKYGLILVLVVLGLVVAFCLGLAVGIILSLLLT